MWRFLGDLFRGLEGSSVIVYFLNSIMEFVFKFYRGKCFLGKVVRSLGDLLGKEGDVGKESLG